MFSVTVASEAQVAEGQLVEGQVIEGTVVGQGGAIPIDGQQSADVEALDPIWTISGAVTAFPRAAR